ncbi:MAG: glycosyltransferase [Acidimicrobiales bacterium]|jgi:GT2 family glycosyltransferase
MPEEYEPPVVAVVVTAEAGAWLDQCLESLAQQDYPSLDVLVIDTGADEGVTARVAAVMPGAFVRRREHLGGFGAAANDVLHGIEGASFFLFCHDDVWLAPDAVRLLVEEAFRSNAAIVGPKLVDWDAPEHLLQIGLGVNRFGSPVPRIEEGELDQSQHDEVREVFAVPSACVLARVDLFAAVGGFDGEMGIYGEDADLCWRAQLAGARVVAVPQAIVRHRQVDATGERPIGDELVLRRRNELRAVLKNYAGARRSVVALELVLLTVIDTLTASVTDRRDRARAERNALRWNFANRPSLVAARRVVRETRQVSDRALAQRMTRRGRLHRALRPAAHIGGGSDLGTGVRWRRPRQAPAQQDSDRLTAWLLSIRRGELPVGQMTAYAVMAFVTVIGIRGLLFGRLPVIGDLVGGPTGTHLLAQWLGGRPDPGWRPTQVAPPAYGLLGLLGTVLGNSSATALKVVYISGLAVGGIGVSRLVRDFGSSRARVIAFAALMGAPLLWNGLALGDIQVSVALAGLPFVFARLARASGLRPFVPVHGSGKKDWNPRSLVAEAAPLGLVLAAMASIAPVVVCDVGVIVLATILASLAVGGSRALLRSAVVGAAGALVAFGCCLPWSLTWLQSGATWSLFAGPVPAGGQGFSPAQLLRGYTGPIGGWWGAFGLVAAAGFVLLWARGARLGWAARWWVCAVGAVALAWVGSQGWLGAGGGGAAVLAAPAAVALAACCGLGAAAFELDIRRHRFGWRQAAGVLAAGCLIVGLAPALGTAFGGRADLPATGFDATSSEFTIPAPHGSRVLWIGNPRALPGTSFQAGPGLAGFVTTSGLPSLSTVWPVADRGPAVQVSADVVAAEAGTTLQLGTLLAPAGIRYLVVPTAAAPVLTGEQTPPASLPPRGLVLALEDQVDLRQLPEEDGVLVWANTDWVSADGPGSIARPGASSNAVLRGLGVAAGLVVILATVGEGVIRRRVPRRRALAGSPGSRDSAPPGGESEVGAAAGEADVVTPAPAEPLAEAEPAAEPLAEAEPHAEGKPTGAIAEPGPASVESGG